MARFKDRSEAGQKLAKNMQIASDSPPVVIVALLQGGLQVAAPIAKHFTAPLEIISVKKITAPEHPGMPLGAISESGDVIWNQPLLKRLGISNARAQLLAKVRLEEIKRQLHAYRSLKSAVDLTDRAVVLVDDGLATGITLRMAKQEVLRRGAKSVHVAMPVAVQKPWQSVQSEIQSGWALETPHSVKAISEWYEDFAPIPESDGLALWLSSQPRDPRTRDIERLARPFNSSQQLQSLAETLASSNLVVFSETVRGFREFSEIRCRLSQILIRDHGFSGIAFDVDWSSSQEVNRRLRTPRGTIRETFKNFAALPDGLWANPEMLALFETMRKTKSDFYGLDLYGSFESKNLIETAAAKGLSEHRLLRHLCQLLDSRLLRVGLAMPELFDSRHNAQLIHGAETYYRKMLHQEPDFASLCEEHAWTNLQLLLKAKTQKKKLILWSQNPSLGHRLQGTAGWENIFRLGFAAFSGLERTWQSDAFSALRPLLAESDFAEAAHASAQNLGLSSFLLMFDEKSRKGPLGAPSDKGNSLPATDYEALFFFDQASPLMGRWETPTIIHDSASIQPNPN